MKEMLSEIASFAQRIEDLAIEVNLKNYTSFFWFLLDPFIFTESRLFRCSGYVFYEGFPSQLPGVKVPLAWFHKIFLALIVRFCFVFLVCLLAKLLNQISYPHKQLLPTLSCQVIKNLPYVQSLLSCTSDKVVMFLFTKQTSKKQWPVSICFIIVIILIIVISTTTNINIIVINYLLFLSLK